MWLKDLVTGKDNTTHDLGRWSWIGSFLAIVGHGFYSLYHGLAVSLTDLATALSAVAAAHGIAIGVKKDTEPPKE